MTQIVINVSKDWDPVDSLDANERGEQFFRLATTHSYRTHMVRKKIRRDPDRVATPRWVACELLYLITDLNPDLADAVVVVTIADVTGLLGGELTMSTPLPGRRIARLRYTWREIEPHLHMKPRDMSDHVLTKMAEAGGVLRARVRHERDAK